MTSVVSPQPGSAAERVRHFSGQLLTADDMNAEQQYFRRRLRRHLQYMLGWGVTYAVEVKAAPTPEHHWLVRVCPGYVVTPRGDEILIGSPVDVDLAAGADRPVPLPPCPQRIDEAWVVLAAVTLSAERTDEVTHDLIDVSVRRVLLSTSALQLIAT